MSLPPYKHTRNPALEREDEYCPPKEVPLIIHTGVVEKRKTTDIRLIRSEPPHPGVQFEYLPLLLDIDLKNVLKNTPQHSETHAKDSEKKSSTREQEETKENVETKSKDTSDATEQQENDDTRSTCSKRSSASRKSRLNDQSPTSQRSVKSSRSTVSSLSSTTIKDVLKETSPSKSCREAQAQAYKSQSRHLANGLNEADQFLYWRR